jgi:two-component sensor histidine kinase
MDASGRIIGASKIARDITERYRLQEQQKLLIGEMKHRIKNSLTTIQAIATQTLKQPTERDSFIARLHALDSAYDLLTSDTWERAPLDEIVARALKPFQERCHERRIGVDGPPDIWLDATKSVLVALAIHELATNAVKYGALSNGAGHISVGWRRKPDSVQLVWQERGGPEVMEPKHKGFGSHLIEQAFARQLGDAELVFNPQGLTCTLEVHTEDVTSNY